MKKILNINELKSIRSKHKKNKIILAHGTFDFFHYGHLRHLLESKKQADILVVSITADNFVRKGPGRPVYSQKQRAEIISSLDFVDYVAIINFQSSNISGGITRIKNGLNKKDTYSSLLKKGDYILVNDNKFFHYTDPININGKGKYGCRDTLVITIKFL